MSKLALRSSGVALLAGALLSVVFATQARAGCNPPGQTRTEIETFTVQDTATGGGSATATAASSTANPNPGTLAICEDSAGKAKIEMSAKTSMGAPKYIGWRIEKATGGASDLIAAGNASPNEGKVDSTTASDIQSTLTVTNGTEVVREFYVKAFCDGGAAPNSANGKKDADEDYYYDINGAVIEVKVVVLKVEMMKPENHYSGDTILDGTIIYWQFNDAQPGVCSVQCYARTTPDSAGIQTLLSGKIQWSIAPITGSTLSWKTDATRSGSVAAYQSSYNWWESIALYTALPQENSSFGSKDVSYTVTGLGCSDSGVTKIYFTEDAKNHPGTGSGSTPNWFFYWSQTSAGSGYTYTYEAGAARSRMKYAGSKWSCFITDSARNLPVLHNERTSTDYVYKGINAFGFAVRHEEKHRLQAISMWGDGGGLSASPYNASLDSDGDLLKDSEEATLIGSTRKYLVQILPTFADTWNYGPDFRDAEDYCMWQQTWETETAFDSVDWASPGRQWGTGYSTP